jgi:formylglycine-generating enzyme required for sulfatase activity
MKTSLIAITLSLLLIAPLRNAESQQPGVSQWPARAKRYALLIGVNEYDDSQITPLIGPSNDMRALEDALVRHAGFDPLRILRLTTEQTDPALKPTRSNIFVRLSSWLKAVPSDGLLFLAFSGHGAERNGRAFLLPSDGRVNDDINVLENTAVEVAALRKMISDRRVAQVVVLLDSCRNDPTAGKDLGITPMSRAYNFDLRNSNVKAFVTLYAASVGQRAFENRARRRGYFIDEVVAALEGAAVNERGEVTLQNLISHVEDRVPLKVLRELAREQQPYFETAGVRMNDLVIAVAAVPPKPTPAPTPVVATKPTPTPAPARLSVTGAPLTALSFTTANVNAQGQKINERTAQCWGFTEMLPGGAPLEMVEVAGGEFWMGEDAAGAAEYERECGRYVSDKNLCKTWANWATPRHRVTVKTFAMGKYEVTQRQWKAVMGGLPEGMNDLGAEFKGDDLPVVRVSWDDVQVFLKKLGKGYRLPSEAEWEYAARADSTTAFAFGPTISPAVVNYNGKYPHGQAAEGEYRQRPVRVGSFPANKWGLFDMHGNVWEWCEDQWHDSYSGAPSDGRAWVDISATGSNRVNRGGSWNDYAVGCRSAFRDGNSPGIRDDYLGFRLVRT